jgi:hypothetical protein
MLQGIADALVERPGFLRPSPLNHQHCCKGKNRNFLHVHRLFLSIQQCKNSIFIGRKEKTSLFFTS